MVGGRVVDAAGTRELGVQRGGGSGELRQGNLTQILKYLRDHGPSSRHDIARGCGLGVSTMTDLIGDLRSRRLVMELEPIRRLGAGRPTRPIALDGAPWCVVGVHVDVDQAHVSAATVGGEELWRESYVSDLATQPDGPAALTKALRDLLTKIPDDTTLVAVQIGVPGHVGSSGIVTSRSLGWTDVPVAGLVSDMLVDAGYGDIHVGVSAVSNLAGLHAVRTQLKEPSRAVAVYLGGLRDVDGALLVDGEIFAGAAGGAGDLAHLNVSSDGPGCWCGRRGCLNAFLRPEHLLTAGGLMSTTDAVQVVSDQPDTAAASLAAAAEQGDDSVLKVLDEAGDVLGLVLDNLLGTVNPDAVILGGYLGRLATYLQPALDRRLQTRETESAYAATRIVSLTDGVPQVAAGAVLAARDACLYDPLNLTTPLG